MVVGVLVTRSVENVPLEHSGDIEQGSNRTAVDHRDVI
jgi:hypothetical protein